MSERQQLALIKQLTEQKLTPDKSDRLRVRRGDTHYSVDHNLWTSIEPAPPPPLQSVATPYCPG